MEGLLLEQVAEELGLSFEEARERLVQIGLLREQDYLGDKRYLITDLGQLYRVSVGRWSASLIQLIDLLDDQLEETQRAAVRDAIQRNLLPLDPQHCSPDMVKQRTKVCKKCGIARGEEAFFKSSRHKDKLTSWCKDCHKGKSAETKTLYMSTVSYMYAHAFICDEDSGQEIFER